RDPEEARRLLDRVRAVAEAVAVDLLPRRPADRLRADDVEVAAVHLLLPVPDVVGDRRGRGPLGLEEPGPGLERAQEDSGRREAQGEVLRELAPPHEAT